MEYELNIMLPIRAKNSESIFGRFNEDDEKMVDI